jgi:ABC-2 type transport system permease protein
MTSLPSTALSFSPATQEAARGGVGLLHHLPTEDREAQLLWRLRFRIAETHLKQLLRTSRLRMFLVAGLSICFWLGMFILFYEGFTFVVEQVGRPGAMYHAETFRFVFHLFFLSLNVMLVFSSGIILYTGLCHSPESRFLLTLPVRAERIVLYKFQESLFYSSWGFFLLASPIVVAYGIVSESPWSYYALLAPLIVSFVYIPCSIGALLCLLIIYKLPNLRRVIIGLAAVVVILFTTPTVWETFQSSQARNYRGTWFVETLHRFRFTQSDWLPSSWITSSLLEAAQPSASVVASPYVTELPTFKGFMYMALLISNALLLHVVLTWASKRWFRPAYSGFAIHVPKARRMGFARTDWIAERMLRIFDEPVRLLFIKDWRLLRRDPAQWSQFLIFFGLLVLYFFNIDRFKNPTNQVGTDAWINMVSFLNLAVVGLILSTFTTRFIYPMVSLEGQCLWILGLLPVSRGTIIWGKFWFASIGSWIPCAMLVLLSDLMLRVPSLVVWVHQLTCVLLCVGLASIAVGLGATMPNFRETSPSKIAAGFGGTLNLVLSALYIMVIVILTALPSHFYVGKELWGNLIIHPDRLRWWLILGMAGALVTGTVATVVPLRKGLQAFGKLEFS